MTAILLESKPSKEEIKEKNILVLSVSKAKTFLSCKAKYKKIYIEKMPKKEWDFLLVGKFLHRILELFHIYIENHNIPLNVAMGNSFKEALKEYGSKIIKEKKQQAYDICLLYLRQVSQLQQENKLPTVLGNEKEFNILIDNKVLINGFIDRVSRFGSEIEVCDYKTSNSTQFLEKDLFQLLTYAFVMKLTFPDVKQVKGSYLMLFHDLKKIEKVFSEEEIFSVENKFLEYAAQINNEVVFAPTTSILCGYCDYLKECPDGSKFLTSINRMPIDFTNIGKNSW